VIETFAVTDYLGEAEKHRTRRDQLKRIVDEFQDVDPFDMQRRPVDKTGDYVGVAKAFNAAGRSRLHSLHLYRRAIACHIADDVDYQQDELQTRQDGDDIAEVIMWEDVSSSSLRERLGEHDYVEVTEVEEIDGDSVYTLDVDFDAYYEQEL
jgi:hypothetical protein